MDDDPGAIRNTSLARQHPSFRTGAERDGFLSWVVAELAHILNNHHSPYKMWETVWNPSAGNTEYVSLKAMSGPNKRAVRSRTSSILDRALLSLEGRACGGRKRTLARESLQECLKCPEPITEGSLHHPLLFLAQGLPGSWTVGMSEEQDWSYKAQDGRCWGNNKRLTQELIIHLTPSRCGGLPKEREVAWWSFFPSVIFITTKFAATRNKEIRSWGFITVLSFSPGAQQHSLTDHSDRHLTSRPMCHCAAVVETEAESHVYLILLFPGPEEGGCSGKERIVI